MSSDLSAFLERQAEWSRQTFGEGERVQGNIAHIKKELEEIEANPSDVFEWIDVVLLAFDGASRQGHSPEAIVEALKRKQQILFAREWPEPDPAGTEPVEHIKTAALGESK